MPLLRLQVLGAVPMPGEGVAAANAALDRADQERKKGVPAHRRKNAAWVRAEAPANSHTSRGFPVPTKPAAGSASAPAS
jgi:hypothetical protein